MQIGADDVVAVHALEAVAVVVAVTGDDFPQGLGLGAEVGAAPVVLEAGDQLRAAAEVCLDCDVADQPRAGLADRLQVGDPQARQLLLAELVAVAEQLVAAADRQEDGAVVGRGGDRLLLAGDHVGGDGALVAVLAAADVEEIVGGRVDRLARAGAAVDEADAPPLAAPLQEEDVAAVGVDVHLLGIEAEHAELHHSPLSSRTTREPTWSSVGGISCRPAGAKPKAAASASSVSALKVAIR